MARKYENILETVGNTPVVKINRLAPPSVNLFVKVEAFNPLGSVKDRLALGVIEAAERSGELKPGPDGDRGDQRQHRHRPGHGVRRQRAIRWCHHGGELQCRAAKADAVSGRQGGADAGGAARHGHGR